MASDTMSGHMRIGVAGLGFMGSTHLKALRELPGVTVAAVASSDEQKLTGDLSNIQGNLGGPGERFDFSRLRTYREWQQMVRDPELDAVDLCLPTYLHAAATRMALEAGKHVLVEKPLALHPDEADALVALAKQQGKVLMSAQVLRFMPMYQVLKKTVREHLLGPLHHLTLRRRCAAPFWSQWLGDPAKSGGGVFDLLIHDVDMALHLLGMPYAVSAVGVEELAHGIDVITAHFEYGAANVVVTGGWHHPKSYPFSMEYTAVFHGGTMDYSSVTNKCVLYAGDGAVTELPVAGPDPYGLEIAYFAEAIMSRAPLSMCEPEESAAAVRLTRLMADARHRQGERIVCETSSQTKSA